MIIFLYGPDSFRSREKLNSFKEKFIKDVDKTGLNLLEIDAEKRGLDDLNKIMNTPSFFANKRMIVIKNIFAKKKAEQDEFLEFLKKTTKRDDGTENIIVFWEEKTDKRTTLFKYLNAAKFKEEFLNLEAAGLTSWVQKRVEERGEELTFKRLRY